MKMRRLAAVTAMVSLLSITACAGKESAVTEKSAENTASTEPVTLKLAVVATMLSDESFQKYFVQEVQKKYPHITLERSDPSQAIEDLVASGDIPDIIYSSLPGIPKLQLLDVLEDLSPYIKKYNTDLSRFDPVLMEALQQFGGDNQVIALPYKMNIPALFYNKDIFDRFGVSYPEDGMTWDEAFGLARKLTRQDGGTQYLGIFTGGADRMAMGLNLPYVDMATNKAKLQTDEWQQVLSMFTSEMSLSGYVADGKLPDLWAMFNREKSVAMAAFWGPDAISNFGEMERNGEGFSWDMVTVPTFKKGEGYAWQADAHTLIITSTSKHKEQAYQVLSVMTSDEVQSVLNKNGVLTSLQKTPELIKDYGSEIPSFHGKNVNALFALKPAVKTFTPFDDKGRGLINAAANDVLIKGIDVNTALKSAEEQLDQYIRQHQMANP